MSSAAVEHVVHMAGTGLLVSVVAPLLLLLLRAVGLEPPSVPAPVALPGFVVAHAVLTLAAPVPFGAVLLLLGAVLFWTPVLGRRRLGEAGRIVYLFAAMPALDLAGVWLVARGDGPGGIAMVLGMLPMGLTVLALAWRWMADEERRALAQEGAGG